ncbi:host specificity protein, partial [Escherichia coli]
DELSLGISQVSQRVDNVSSELTQTVSQSNEENARQIAQVRQYVDQKSSEIMTTTDQKLGDQEATIQQIQKVQTDTSNNLNSMWAVKLQQMQDGRL